MNIRDRVQELRRVKACQLRPNPKNWRTHPESQRNAMCGVLAEIGYAGALLARELPDGSLELIDGHLRAETTPDLEVPVLIVDLNDQEAAKLLALHDPLAGMAEAHQELLQNLLAEVETENHAVQALLDRMQDAEEPLPLDDESSEQEGNAPIPETFQVIVECRDESEQQSVFERLTHEGLSCKLLML